MHNSLEVLKIIQLKLLCIHTTLYVWVTRSCFTVHIKLLFARCLYVKYFYVNKQITSLFEITKTSVKGYNTHRIFKQLVRRNVRY